MDGIAWASSAMVAARSRLEIATENLANASTDAFSQIAARGRLTAHGVAIDALPQTVSGPLRRTGRDLDLAIGGSGAFAVRDGRGTVRTREGSFTRRQDGVLCDRSGRELLVNGTPLHVPSDVRFDRQGGVIDAASGAVVGRIPLPAGSSLESGFLQASGVDAIAQMVDVLSAERSFESAQKVVSAIDRIREKAATDVAAVR